MSITKIKKWTIIGICGFLIGMLWAIETALTFSIALALVLVVSYLLEGS